MEEIVTVPMNLYRLRQLLGIVPTLTVLFREHIVLCHYW